MSSRSIIMAGAYPYRGRVRVGIHHYAKLFAEHGWKVCFLSSQCSPLHFIRRQDREYSREKVRLWRSGGEWAGNIFCYSHMTLLPILPFWAPDIVVRNTLRFTVPSLVGVLRKHGFAEVDVVWIENPQFSELASKVKHDLLVYRIADEMRGFEEYSETIIDKHESDLQSADLVVTTARSLFDKYSAMNLPGKILFVPNGVEFLHFNRKKIPKPAEYQEINGPIVLYSGTVGSWFDQELVIACATRLSHMQFMIVGPAAVDVAKMKAVKNIRILGSREYEDLPGYYVNADVGIIPFRKSRLVNAVNPLKLYEYMAAGLPVVSIDTETMRQAQSPALLASDTDSFCDLIKQSLGRKGSMEFEDYAMKNQWAGRFDDVKREIESCLTQLSSSVQNAVCEKGRRV